MLRSVASVLLVVAAGISTSIQAAPVAVHLTGRTAADDELQKDILHTMSLYGSVFNCEAPSAVAISSLNASMVSPNASFYSPALGTSYEKWDATFCGKTHSFLVRFWPDPKGGSFLTVGYPYPDDAPSH